MRHEQGGHAFGAILLHTLETTFLKFEIPDSQHLIGQQNIWPHIDSHRECQPHVHPARVTLDRNVDKFGKSCEFDNLVEMILDNRGTNSIHGRIQEDVFPPAQVGLKAGSEREQRHDPAATDD